MARSRQLRSGIKEAAAAPNLRRQAAKRVFDALREEVVREQIATMPLARIKETTQGRLRLGPIENAGYRTVGAAAAAGHHRLQQIPGVGPHTATQVIAAARQLQAAMVKDVRVRFDPDSRPRLHAALLAELYAYEVAQRSVSPLARDLQALAASLDSVMSKAAPTASRLRMFFTGRSKKEETRNALGQLDSLMRAPATGATESNLNAALAALGRPRPGTDFLWDDYEARAVAYNGLLIEIGELPTDVDAGQGFVPSDIAQRVHQHPLDLSFMRASLRGYQAFGAKFALVQKRAILGDEMGLGKGVEALAAMCHLHAEDKKNFLVVCPASVIVNWSREIRRHSLLTGHRLHGPERDGNFRAWTRSGGVGVTTYEALRSLPMPPGFSLDMLIVDEIVILAEPQWKPTLEDQAIARCHRMGQVRTIDVHRLLAEDSVDQRMLEILASKTALFDEYARRSELKDISPDAVDISDLEATKEASSQAADERRIVEMERKRLRLDDLPMPEPSQAQE
jgi:SNF2-related domain